jgi:hypothetical protein
MHHDFDVEPHMGAQVRGLAIDGLVAELAERQGGVVAHRQLIAMGLGRRAIQHRVKAGRLRPLYRGVYAVGHRVLTRNGRWTAALLACGSGAVLSHRTASAVHGIRETTLIEITTPVARRERAGIRTRTAVLADDEWERIDGLRVTTVARTLLDLAAVLWPQQLEAAMAQASYRELTSPTSLVVLLARHPRRRGTRTARVVLERSPQRTRTIDEADFLAFLDEHGLPRPLTNVPRVVRGNLIEADAVYLEARLIIEIDGGSHKTEKRFHEDRERDRRNLAEGWRTVRVTRLTEELAEDIRRLLRATTSIR